MTTAQPALKIATSSNNQQRRGQLTPHLVKTSAKIAVATSSTTFLITKSNILFCKAEGSYCSITLICGKYILISKPLKTLAAALPKSQFIRTHQSFLANKEQITEVRTSSVQLFNGDELPVSRSGRKEIETFIQSMCTV